MHGFKMAIKQPTFVSFDFKRSSNDQDGLRPSTSGDNTETRSQLIPDVRVPFKRKGPPPLGALEIGGCLRLCGIWVVKVPRNRGDR